jgi:hypothetical protein
MADCRHLKYTKNSMPDCHKILTQASSRQRTVDSMIKMKRCNIQDLVRTRSKLSLELLNPRWPPTAIFIKANNRGVYC